MATIHQEITFTATPARVYEALVDAKRFAEITGAPASGDSTEGGVFSALGFLLSLQFNRLDAAKARLRPQLLRAVLPKLIEDAFCLHVLAPFHQTLAPGHLLSGSRLTQADAAGGQKQYRKQYSRHESHITLDQAPTPTVPRARPLGHLRPFRPRSAGREEDPKDPKDIARPRTAGGSP